MIKRIHFLSITEKIIIVPIYLNSTTKSLGKENSFYIINTQSLTCNRYCKICTLHMIPIHNILKYDEFYKYNNMNDLARI